MSGGDGVPTPRCGRRAGVFGVRFAALAFVFGVCAAWGATAVFPLFAAAAGEFAGTGADAVSDPAPLTLGEVVRRAVETSPDVRRAKLERRLAGLRLRELEVRVASTAMPVELGDARRAYEEAGLRVRVAKVEAAFDAERLYYAVLREERALALRRGATERAERRLDLVRRRHRIGQATELGLMQAEQAVDRAALAEQSAELHVRLARRKLRHAVGADSDGSATGRRSGSDVARAAAGEWNVVFVDPDPDESVTGAFDSSAAARLGSVTTSLNPDRAVAAAVENRIEVREARRVLKMRERDVRLADNAYTPPAELERAEIARAAAELQLEDAVERVRADVWSAIADLREAQGEWRLARRALNGAVAGLDVAERRYAAGQSSLGELLDTEASLAEAEFDVVTATYGVRVARTALLSAMGAGPERWPDLFPEPDRKGDG